MPWSYYRTVALIHKHKVKAGGVSLFYFSIFKGRQVIFLHLLICLFNISFTEVGKSFLRLSYTFYFLYLTSFTVYNFFVNLFYNFFLGLNISGIVLFLIHGSCVTVCSCCSFSAFSLLFCFALTISCLDSPFSSQFLNFPCTIHSPLLNNPWHFPHYLECLFNPVLYLLPSSSCLSFLSPHQSSFSFPLSLFTSCLLFSSSSACSFLLFSLFALHCLLLFAFFSLLIFLFLFLPCSPFWFLFSIYKYKDKF